MPLPASLSDRLLVVVITGVEQCKAAYQGWWAQADEASKEKKKEQAKSFVQDFYETMCIEARETRTVVKDSSGAVIGSRCDMLRSHWTQATDT